MVAGSAYERTWGRKWIHENWVLIKLYALGGGSFRWSCPEPSQSCQRPWVCHSVLYTMMKPYTHHSVWICQLTFSEATYLDKWLNTLELTPPQGQVTLACTKSFLKTVAGSTVDLNGLFHIHVSCHASCDSFAPLAKQWAPWNNTAISK